MHALAPLVFAMLLWWQPAGAGTAPVPPPETGAGVGVQALATHTWLVAGVERTALVYRPRGRAEPAPVVFAFHGHGGTARRAAEGFGYHRLWPEAICVYMQGLPTAGKTDPDGVRPGWQKDVGEYDDRDLAFFDAVVASLKAEDRWDAARVYATGHSNGGGFTYLLAAARPGLFAAIAPSACGSGPLRRAGGGPVAVLHVAGRADEIVRFANQEQTMRAVRARNGCRAEGDEWGHSGDLVATRYRSAQGADFVSVIHPGGHRFPAEAPGLIVRFFRERGERGPPIAGPRRAVRPDRAEPSRPK